MPSDGVNNGKIQVISDIEPKNGQDFPVTRDHYILMEDGTRLDVYLRSITTSTEGMEELTEAIREIIDEKIQEMSNSVNLAMDGMASAVSKLSLAVEALVEDAPIEYEDADEEEY